MKYADELRGSEGEPCIVTDLRNGKQYAGKIEAWDDATKKADVRYTDGTLVRVGFSFVTMTTEEKP